MEDRKVGLNLALFLVVGLYSCSSSVLILSLWGRLISEGVDC